MHKNLSIRVGTDDSVSHNIAFSCEYRKTSSSESLAVGLGL